MPQEQKPDNALIDAARGRDPVQKKPEALRPAAWCDAHSSGVYRTSAEAATELLRLHARVQELEIALSEETKNADVWRDLALQFDGHRMAALGHLRMLLSCPDDHAGAATVFLSSPPPLSGEQVLAERIAGMAQAQRMPLSYWYIDGLKQGPSQSYRDFARAIERAHGITQEKH